MRKEIGILLCVFSAGIFLNLYIESTKRTTVLRAPLSFDKAYSEEIEFSVDIKWSYFVEVEFDEFFPFDELKGLLAPEYEGYAGKPSIKPMDISWELKSAGQTIVSDSSVNYGSLGRYGYQVGRTLLELTPGQSYSFKYIVNRPFRQIMGTSPQIVIAIHPSYTKDSLFSFGFKILSSLFLLFLGFLRLMTNLSWFYSIICSAGIIWVAGLSKGNIIH